MLFRFENPVIKIISSQEFITQVTMPYTHRRKIWYNERIDIRLHTLDDGFVGDKTLFKLNAIFYRKPMHNFKMICIVF